MSVGGDEGDNMENAEGQGDNIDSSQGKAEPSLEEPL